MQKPLFFNSARPTFNIDFNLIRKEMKTLNPKNKTKLGYICPECKIEHEIALYFIGVKIINGIRYEEHRCSNNHGSFYSN